MTNDQKELIQNATRGELLNALEVVTEPEIRSAILEELLNR